MAGWQESLLRQLAEPSAAQARSVPPPPPPPPPPPVRVTKTPEQLRYEEFMSKQETLPPAPDGTTRLFRVGETATNYVPPKTVKQWGQEIPYEQWRASLRDVQENGPTPHGANGRWATDAPEQLDFYINDNPIDTPIYYFDVPGASQYNVANTPFAKNSRNIDREFVLPDEQLRAGKRLMSLAPFLLAPAAGQGGSRR